MRSTVCVSLFTYILSDRMCSALGARSEVRHCLLAQQLADPRVRVRRVRRTTRWTRHRGGVLDA